MYYQVLAKMQIFVRQVVIMRTDYFHRTEQSKTIHTTEEGYYRMHVKNLYIMIVNAAEQMETKNDSEKLKLMVLFVIFYE